MAAPDLTIVPVRTKADRDAFIDLPYRLQADDPTWVPPLRIERQDALDPKKTNYLQRAEHQLWIARRDDRVVGRISAQIDPFVARVRETGEGHFGWLAAEDDAAVVAALLDTAEAWLAERGCTHAIGPLSFSINQQPGLLIDGHDTPPMLLMPQDPLHLAGHLGAHGYAKARDLYAYLLGGTDEAPKAVPLRKGLTLRQIDMKDYKAEVRRLGEIFNDAWSENWGFVPFSPEEIEALAGELRPIIDKRLVWFADYDGEPVAFIVCLPNVNEAIADLGGKLLPFGWAKLLWRLKVRGLTSARIPLMGLRKRHAGTITGALILGGMVAELRREARALGLTQVEMSWVLEDNVAMNRFAEHVGGRVYKTYRLYRKDLP
ncbi:MAG: GNAT family N-acetyltransferase [Pseudomonadota bacterium]